MPAGGEAGEARRSAASPSARLSEAPSHGPITRLRITDMATATAIRPIATAIGHTAIRPIATDIGRTAIRPIVTAIRPTAIPRTTATHVIINGTVGRPRRR